MQRYLSHQLTTQVPIVRRTEPACQPKDACIEAASLARRLVWYASMVIICWTDQPHMHEQLRSPTSVVDCRSYAPVMDMDIHYHSETLPYGTPYSFCCAVECFGFIGHLGMGYFAAMDIPSDGSITKTWRFIEASKTQKNGQVLVEDRQLPNIAQPRVILCKPAMDDYGRFSLVHNISIKPPPG